MRAAITSLLSSLALAACFDARPFVCERDDQCVDEGRAGTCEGAGYCSFPDVTCASGRRFGRFASDALADRCVSCAVQVSIGFRHACARLAEGSVQCWGRNDNGQLGDGTVTSRLSPVAVSTAPGGPALSGVIGLSAGQESTACAITGDGVAWCWGANGCGQIGDGTMTDRRTPVRVDVAPSTPLADVTRIAAGERHTCARTVDGVAWCWGCNDSGQLGDGTTMAHVFAAEVLAMPGTPLTDVAQVATGVDHSCARMTDGTLRCWGLNTYGQLGDGTTTASWYPVTVAGAAGVVEVSVGFHHTCARRDDGTVWCWGDGDRGRVGYGEQPTDFVLLPVQVDMSASGVRFVEVEAGDTSTCGRREDHSVWCWGANDNGRLGDGTTEDRLAPVPVVLPERASSWDAIGIGLGDDSSCAVRADGSVWCWGIGDSGVLGNGMSAVSFVPVRAMLECD